MKILTRNSFILIILLLTSCNVLTTDSFRTAEPDLQKATQFQAKITITPPLPDSQVSVTPTAIQTSELPIITTPLIPTDILTQNPTETNAQPYLEVQVGSPVGITNFAHPELGCDWMGLAGQIIDIDDQPVKDIVVEVGGTLRGMPFFGLAVTGESSVYGPGGFEIVLADEPIASDETLWAIVYDLDGNIISSPAYFPTYADCEKNLIILNFIQTRDLSSNWIYLPIIYKKSLNP